MFPLYCVFSLPLPPSPYLLPIQVTTKDQRDSSATLLVVVKTQQETRLTKEISFFESHSCVYSWIQLAIVQ